MAEMSDDDLEIIGESLGTAETGQQQQHIKVVKSDEESLECQILDDRNSDLIVLDSVENGREDEEEGELVDSDSNGQVDVVENNNDDHDTHDKRIRQLEEKIKILEEENFRLKKELKDPTIEVVADVNKGFKLVMSDPKLDRKYRSMIEAFITELITKVPVQQDTPPPSSSDFFVDKFSNGKTEDTTESWSIPFYDRSSNVPLLGETIKPKEEDDGSNNFKLKCFNCCGNHRIDVCQKPSDRNRINQNKKLFQLAQKNSPSSRRYHLGAEYNELKPGQISEDLRCALDLQPNQLPLYVYRMRVLGYPPGWLKESEVQNSGIALYDTDGKVVVDDQIECDTINSTIYNDPQKLVNYPGFNVPVPFGFIDEHKVYGLPSIQRKHSRSDMEKTMKTPTPYKKRKPSSSHTPSRNKRLKIEEISIDMDVEPLPGGFIGFQPPLPSTPSPRKRPPQPPVESSATTDEEETIASSARSSESPTLTDLEEAKQKLISKLVDDLDSEDNNCITDQVQEVNGASNPPIPAMNSSSQGDSSFTVIDSISDNSSDESEKSSLSVLMGTPVLKKMHSPFAKLPDSASFAKGVSEHIPFENLPSSTGSYDKMRQVLSKVREKNI